MAENSFEKVLMRKLALHNEPDEGSCEEFEYSVAECFSEKNGISDTRLKDTHNPRSRFEISCRVPEPEEMDMDIVQVIEEVWLSCIRFNYYEAHEVSYTSGSMIFKFITCRGGRPDDACITGTVTVKGIPEGIPHPESPVFSERGDSISKSFLIKMPFERIIGSPFCNDYIVMLACESFKQKLKYIKEFDKDLPANYKKLSIVIRLHTTIEPYMASCYLLDGKGGDTLSLVMDIGEALLFLTGRQMRETENPIELFVKNSNFEYEEFVEYDLLVARQAPDFEEFERTHSELISGGFACN